MTGCGNNGMGFEGPGGNVRRIDGLVEVGGECGDGAGDGGEIIAEIEVATFEALSLALFS